MAHNVRTAIYMRVSTEEQVEGYGLEVQREKCRAQAIVKGWEVVAEFVDEGISGTKDETQRAGLQTLLDGACNHDFEAVIVLALDRLGRRTMLVLDLVERLSQCGVAFVSCKESLDTTTPQGNFVLTMFAALAQLERDTIVERTTAGRDARGRKDGEKGGRVPLGYERMPTGEIIVVPEQAEIVRQIFGLRGKGYTMRVIADELNENQVPTSRWASKWYASSVKNVLDNEDAYRGGNRGESSVRWQVILTLI